MFSERKQLESSLLGYQWFHDELWIETRKVMKRIFVDRGKNKWIT